jgi:hypothetical protein
MASSSNQPNTTLYVNNLNDKVNKEELRLQLFALFTTYGKIIDIVASKSQQMRGQAFLVFTDLAGATSAMRACEGMDFYDKPLVSIQTYNWRLYVLKPLHSTLIMPNRNRMQRYDAKTHHSYHPPLRMQVLWWLKTQSGKETTRRLMENGSPSEKRLRKTRKRWKLTMRMTWPRRMMPMLVRRDTLDSRFIRAS